MDATFMKQEKSDLIKVQTGEESFSDAIAQNNQSFGLEVIPPRLSLK